MTAPRNTIGPLVDALNLRALSLAQTLLPAGANGRRRLAAPLMHRMAPQSAMGTHDAV
ncbi:MAG: hypothetical protein IOC52_05380 [Methylobacterium sp.]|nr:hypothetical protein [Methylobacterium sp.]